MPERFKVIFLGVDGHVMVKWYSLEEIGKYLSDKDWPGWVGLWESDWVGCEGDTLFMLSPQYRAAINRLVNAPRGQERRAWEGLPLSN